MKKIFWLLLLIPASLFAQKNPLDHSVYDSWQSISERVISNNGKWIAYTITPQEGDADLYIVSADNRNYLQKIPRGYNVTITEDSRYAIFKIKPPYHDSRQAKIKKKKPEDMPKDSLGIVELGKQEIIKMDRIKSYKVPEKGFGWVAIQKELSPAKEKKVTDKSVDSLKRTIDSLTILVKELKNVKGGVKDSEGQFADTAANDKSSKGSELIIFNLQNSSKKIFSDIGDYEFDDNGDQLALFVYQISKDSVNQNGVILYTAKEDKSDTILRKINEVKSLAFSEGGKQLAFLAEKGHDKKALQKYFELYLYRQGDMSASEIINRSSSGMPDDNLVSENGDVRFSKNGQRLFFGTGPVPLPKDTAIADIDLVKVDIWNYKDDYLQSQQLSRLKGDLKRSYLAVYDLATKKMQQLGSEGLPTVLPTAEGNGEYFVAITDTGRRVASQWTGSTLKDIYALNVNTGSKKLVKKNLAGQVYPSSTGKYILMYDDNSKNYFSYDGSSLKNITSLIKVPLYDELNDVPASPNPYGIMAWQEGDAFVYIYDRYDVWKVDPAGKGAPVNMTKDGRTTKQTYRYIRVDRDEKFLSENQLMVFDVLNNVNKSAKILEAKLSFPLKFTTVSAGNVAYSRPLKAKDANDLIYTKETYIQSPDLYVFEDGKEKKLTAINPQQSEYNWGTAELFNWKTFSGKSSTGIVYKPEDFDSTKKYPVILYFYERLSDGLYRYIAPEPTRSRLNISFFVSRGYIVFAPDIAYIDGHPGPSAYDYIVSGAQALGKKSWIDSKNMGIQGQSWGGYQVAYLITRTNMFKAAWAGAPVVNMFSAYGGIRWESGMNRQFQYEKTQSRIGATIWDRPDLYIENSPLFHLKKVNTPVVIMSNDADGAVPWYQGIEMFTALRRLGKPVWLLNYNGEAHNLVERRNKKDIQIREQQFFDWLLKGDKPPRWITEGVKAINKEKDRGLEIE